MIPIARWSSTATASPSAAGARLPAPWQDILDLAYYSGWRKNEILGLTWDELDEAGGVIRLSPARSKTWVGRIPPISPPIADALARRHPRPLLAHDVSGNVADLADELGFNMAVGCLPYDMGIVAEIASGCRDRS